MEYPDKTIRRPLTDGKGTSREIEEAEKAVKEGDGKRRPQRYIGSTATKAELAEEVEWLQSQIERHGLQDRLKMAAVNHRYRNGCLCWETHDYRQKLGREFTELRSWHFYESGETYSWKPIYFESEKDQWGRGDNFTRLEDLQYGQLEFDI